MVQKEFGQEGRWRDKLKHGCPKFFPRVPYLLMENHPEANNSSCLFGSINTIYFQ